jgi:hypothetical protein
VVLIGNTNRAAPQHIWTAIVLLAAVTVDTLARCSQSTA